MLKLLQPSVTMLLIRLLSYFYWSRFSRTLFSLLHHCCIFTTITFDTITKFAITITITIIIIIIITTIIIIMNISSSSSSLSSSSSSSSKNYRVTIIILRFHVVKHFLCCNPYPIIPLSPMAECAVGQVARVG